MSRAYIKMEFLLGIKYPVRKRLYKKTNRRVETLCKIMDSIFLSIVLIIIIPKATICYFKYFLTDLGMDAFEMSLPMW